MTPMQTILAIASLAALIVLIACLRHLLTQAGPRVTVLLIPVEELTMFDKHPYRPQSMILDETIPFDEQWQVIAILEAAAQQHCPPAQWSTPVETHCWAGHLQPVCLIGRN